MNPDHDQHLLTELRTAIAARQATERTLAEFDLSASQSSTYAADRELQSLTAKFDQQLEDAQEKYSTGRQEQEAQYQAETAEIRAEHARAAGEADARFNAESARMEKKFKEDSWLVSSILDDKSENSPKWQFETLRSQLEKAEEGLAQQWEEIQSVFAGAVSLLERRRQQVGPDPDPRDEPPNREAALLGFTEAGQAVRDGAARLARQVLPRLFFGWLPAAFGLVLWGLLFGAAYQFVRPSDVGLVNRNPQEWLLICAGAGLGVTCIVLVIAYSVAVHQMHSAFEPLHQARVDAESDYRAWQRLAMSDLERLEKNYHERYDAIVEQRDRSLSKFEAERTRRLQTLSSERELAVRSATRIRDDALRDAAERNGRQRAEVDAQLRTETSALRKSYEQAREQLTRDQRQAQSERNARRAELWNELAVAWSLQVAQLEAACAAQQAQSRAAFDDWEQIDSADWRPSERVPPGIRIGDYQVHLPAFLNSDEPGYPLEGDDQTYLLPALLKYPESPSLLLKASGAGKSAAVAIQQVAMLRLMTSFRPGDVRFTIIDPVGLGENFAAFMHLADYDDLLISSRIWTEPAHIERQLANLTEHVENVFQKYLRNDFATIEEYNVHAGEVAEPYHFLIVANFPVGFSDRSAQRLSSLAASGARCGVHILLSVDTRLPLPREFSLAEFEATANVLTWTDGQFINPALGPEVIPLIADPPPPPPLFVSLIRKIGDLSRHVRRVEVPFHRIVPREDAWWTSDSRSLIEVPLGRAGATKLQFLRLGPGTSQHVLTAGKTGSGKSTLLHVIVTNLALRYSPAELEFYLIDFKKGVEFKTYATRQLPHARVISIESDREFGVSTLERLDAVLKERGDLFREQGVQDIASFRNARPDVRMPRILFIVDEFQEFFIEDDQYSQTAALLLDRLVRQGRAFGMHVLLGSQTLGGAYSLPRTTMGQMAVRIALQCSEADAHLILSEDNTAARLLTRPGEALYNDANGTIEGNSPFQVAWLNDEERDDCLDRIHSLAVERDEIRFDPIVFEGNVPADPTKNSAFRAVIEAQPPTNPKRKRGTSLIEAEPHTNPKRERGTINDQPSSPHEAHINQPHEESRRPVESHQPSIEELLPRIWLGEAVAITGPTEIQFARRSGCNLLIVGQDPNAAQGILANGLAALAAQLRGVDGLSADEHSADSQPVTSQLHLLTGEAASASRQRWSNVVRVLATDVNVAGPGDAAGVLTQVSEEMTRRQESRTPAAPLFLLIDDLSKFRDLRKSDDDFGFGSMDRDKAPAPGKLLADLLRDGPAVGVHLIVWCDSYNNVDRWFSRQSLREFEMRVAFQMSATDSSNLIDSPAAARLGPNRALLYSDERGTLEKFRPYAPPNEDWLAWIDQSEPPAPEEPGIADDIESWVVL